MSSPTPPRGPTAGAVVLILLTAALVGFLGGALAAVTTGSTPPDVLPGAVPTTGVPTSSPAATQQPPEAGSSLTLTADRSQAATDELIRLEGRLEPARGEVTLQVQQSVDGADFVDFPVTAQTRSDGSYGVWVRTGRDGRNQFRMVAQVDGQRVVSPAAVVVISG